MERLFRHKTPYGIVSETYDIDKKVIRNFTFYSNHKHGSRANKPLSNTLKNGVKWILC